MIQPIVNTAPTTMPASANPLAKPARFDFRNATMLMIRPTSAATIDSTRPTTPRVRPGSSARDAGPPIDPPGPAGGFAGCAMVASSSAASVTDSLAQDPATA